MDCRLVEHIKAVLCTSLLQFQKDLRLLRAREALRSTNGKVTEPYEWYLHDRVQAFPDPSGARLLCEIREMGYAGSSTAVADVPPRQTQSERRFESPPGRQAQVDFAEFTVAFADEPGVVRKVWLFSIE
jgi:transposase